MYILMESNKIKVSEPKPGIVAILLSDRAADVSIHTNNEPIKLNMGDFKQDITTLELMECLQESFESGHFYIDAIEDYILGIEADRDQLLIEIAQLRRELESARTVYLGRG